jgi:hypothetical protein
MVTGDKENNADRKSTWDKRFPACGDAEEEDHGGAYARRCRAVGL